MEHLTSAVILIAITGVAFGACGIGLLVAVGRSESEDDE